MILLIYYQNFDNLVFNIAKLSSNYIYETSEVAVSSTLFKLD